MRRLRRYQRNPDDEPPKAKGVSEHIYYSKYQAKTVCTSAVLAAFGIDACSYHYSGHLEQRNNILRKNGWASRSRNSHINKAYRKLKLPKGTKSVGRVRKIIAYINKGNPEVNAWGDPRGTRYMIKIKRHALLLDYMGQTIVDTDPRKRDARKVIDIRAVFRNPNRTNPICEDCGKVVMYENNPMTPDGWVQAYAEITTPDGIPIWRWTIGELDDELGPQMQTKSQIRELLDNAIDIAEMSGVSSPGDKLKIVIGNDTEESEL